MKQKLLKSFLLAVTLLVGESAWGTDITVNTTDNFNYSNGTCLNETYTDGGSTVKDAIGILVKDDTGNRSGTLSFGTTTTADKILLTANFLISTGNQNESSFKVIDQAGNEIFALSIGGSSTVTLTDYSGQSTAAGGITTERTQVSTFGGNQYYKTRWTAVTAYLDFTKHYGVVSVGSGKYEIQMSAASTGVKGFYLTGGKYYGASLVAKDYTTTEVTGRYAAGMDVLSANTGGTDYKTDYTDYNSVTKNAVGIYAKPNVSANRYGTLTLGATTSANYINVSGNFVLESGNNDASATYLKAIDQSGDEIFAIRMTGNNTTSVKLTDSDNTDGTEVMTVTKRKDSTIGNGSSTYGLTAWTYFNAELNFADHTGSVTIGSTTYSISLKSTSTGIKGFALQAGRGFGAALLSSDYSVTVAAGPVTVKYVDGESNEIAAATTLSVAGKLPGETLGFFSPKFITYEGDLYIIGADASATNPTTNQSVTLTSSAQDKYITYTKKAEGTYYFYEFDGGYTTRANYESNGSAATQSVNVTVPSTGVYVVTANCYGSTDTRTATVRVGETTIVSPTTLGIYAPGTNLVSGNVLLSEGDIINVTTSSSKDGIDYIILQKLCDVTDASKVLGAVDYTTNYASVWNSTPVWINAGETGYYKIKNWNNTASANLYENWYIWAANENSQNLVIFGPNHSNTPTNATYNSKPTFTMDDLNGATVELYFKLTDAGDGTYTWTTTAVTTKADGTELTPNLVYTQTGINVSRMKAYVSVEKSWLEVLEQKLYAVDVKVTSAGYATYVNSDYDLNFTDTDIKAYKVKVNTKGKATMTQVNNVPAGTPVLLYYEGGKTEDIPVMTGAAAVTENDLVAGTGAAVPTSDGEGNTNMILNNVDSKIGFYFAAGQTVATNRAYLHIASTLAPDASESRMVMVFADDEATAVFDLNDKSEMINNNWYDLQGRRVDGSRLNSGIYIKNGKKVVVK
jgi:hypothetical protein